LEILHVHCDVGTEYLNTIQINLSLLVADFAMRKSGFDAGAGYLNFLVDNLVLVQAFLWVFLFFLVSIIPSMSLTHLQFSDTLTRRSSGAGNCQRKH